MNNDQLNQAKNGAGFIAALDQSGGSTPKALRAYGVSDDQYKNEDEMFSLIHDMRTRIMTNPAFTSEKIMGAILFEQTMRKEVDGTPTAKYLLDKGILPFLKIDKGLEAEKNGVQLMKPIPGLEETLKEAKDYGIFGTKERSNINSFDEQGIKENVDQQFELAKKVCAAGLIPIVEPEVNINAVDKEKIEDELHKQLLAHVEELSEDENIMLKLTLPTKANLYKDLVDHPRVIRVVALSGGYSLEQANELLAQNEGVVASFSRALTGNLSINQSEDEFTEALSHAISTIFDASMAK